MIKTQTIRHEETSTGTGEKTEKWCVPDMQVTLEGAAVPVVSLPNGAGSTTYTDYSATDFPGFEWLGERNFTGVAKVEGQDCLIFREESKPKDRDANPEAATLTVACINTATRLPVQLQTGEETLTYEFEVAPTAMLLLPPEVEKAVEQWRKTMSQSALMPSKP